MYVWLWRVFPGNWAAKLAASLALFAAVLAVLLFLVFPFVEPRLPWNNVNVDQPANGQTVDQPNVSSSGLGPLRTVGPVEIRMPLLSASRA